MSSINEDVKNHIFTHLKLIKDLSQELALRNKMVSVCIATYNGEDYISQQIDSILQEIGEDDEIIISDDCSKDSTLTLIEEKGDSRIKVFQNQEHDGVVKNFENAIRHAAGDVIVLCDQDDIWKPNKIKRTLESLQTYDFFTHNAEIIDKEGKVTGANYFNIRKTKYGYFSNLWKMGYLGCCMAFKKECLKYILPFPKQILWHDMWIAAVLHLKYKGELSHESYIQYRRHDNNASTSSEKSNFSMGLKIKYRLVLLYFSIKRCFC